MKKRAEEEKREEKDWYRGSLAHVSEVKGRETQPREARRLRSME